MAHLAAYASAAHVPVREGTAVSAARRDDDDDFVLDTTGGTVRARRLVVANGAYQRPLRPPGAETLPADSTTLDVDGLHERRLPSPGRVLIVGSGQSGCQMAEELHEAGRDVALACGRAPWAQRRIGGRDVFWWVVETGYMAQTLSAFPDPSAARLAGNILATGHGGGHDLHLRTLQAMGVRLVGRFLGAEAGSARFAQDLRRDVAWSDARHRDLMDMVLATAVREGLEAPEDPEPGPFDDRSPERLGLAGFGAVIFTGGFRPDYRSWLPWPEAFDDEGFPLQVDGASTVVPGLWFMGVHFLRTRKSSLLFGVGEDAAVVAEAIAASG